jgi:hypothetical protein
VRGFGGVGNYYLFSSLIAKYLFLTHRVDLNNFHAELSGIFIQQYQKRLKTLKTNEKNMKLLLFIVDRIIGKNGYGNNNFSGIVNLILLYF